MSSSAFDKGNSFPQEKSKQSELSGYVQVGSFKIDSAVHEDPVQGENDYFASAGEIHLDQNSLFYSIFRKMPQPIVLTRMSDNRVADCSEYFEKIAGVCRGEILGHTSLDFGIWEDVEERDRFLDLVALSGTVRNFEGRLKNACGEFQTWLLSAQKILLQSVWHILISFTNIEDRVRAEEEKRRLEDQLRQQQKLEAIGALAGGVAHEVNNPINIIINFAEIIRDDVEHFDGAESIKEYAANIISESRRISVIIRNLLSFSRPEKEQLSAVGMNSIIESTSMLTRRILARDGITLAVEIESDLPPALCRSRQIMQVLLNLVINSRDALNERYKGYHHDKQISITSCLHVKGGGKWLRTCVEDHGCGISKENAERVFEPFFSTKPQGSGTGLGLSVSLEIIKEHQGRLSFESEKDGATRFFVDLPVG